QFLSPQVNERTDEYGGSLENRLRLSIQVIETVREYVGNDFTIGIRISADELTHGGRNVDDTKEIVRRLETTGCLDYLSVAGATVEPISVGQKVIPSFDAEQAVYADRAGQLRKSTSLPLLYAGKALDPEVAEKLLRDD